MTAIRPFHIDIPQARLDDLADRLRRALWPDELPSAGDAYGVPGDRVRVLAQYWLDGFNWRALESRLNTQPQFVTEIDGEDIHFLHVRSTREDATPVILTHGWPGSILEYLDVIAPLTEPESAEAPAFHVVIPSLPGFGFSGPTHSTGWGTHRTARAWLELMDRLGYRRFAAIGNDAGSMISPEIGRLAPDRVIGIHVTQLFSFPSGDPAEMAGLSQEDASALAHLQWFHENKMAFNILHSQQPQTLAYALADSPLGLLGWNAQLFGEPATVPTALAMFAGDFQSIRRFAERDHKNIVSWNSYDTGSAIGSPNDAGGHYAAHEAPEVLLGDIRQFFTDIG